MSFQKIIKEYVSKHCLGLFILFSFALWAYLFRGFLTSDLRLLNDAIPYYEHIKFFLDNISQGIYPLWDPYWNNGVANEFFLRRIGSYNPFYFLVLAFKNLGITYTHSYLLFIAGYYFLGMIGFFKLTRIFFRDETMAFLAFLLLMFSSLGTMVFDSFIILIFVPGVWFFYFLMAFYREPQKYSLLGITFCLMLILTTYIPFFFLTILLSFLFFFICFYTHEFKTFIIRGWNFIKQNKGLAILCLGSAVLAMMPGVLFMQEAGEGAFVMPTRSYDAQASSLSVGSQVIIKGGVVAQSVFTQLIANLKHIRVATLYLPVFVYILLLLGLVVRINKRIMFLVFWGLSIFLIGLYDATPIYPFLYKHVFYFKYFRNFQFFRWLFLLPLFIIICTEHFRLFLEYVSVKDKRALFLKVFVIFIHLVFLAFLLTRENVVISTFLGVGVSLAGFLWILSVGSQSIKLIQLFLMIAVVVQPIEVYSYLKDNSLKNVYPYRYDNVSLDFSYGTEQNSLSSGESQMVPKDSLNLSVSRPASIYYSTKDYLSLSRLIPKEIFDRYISNKFIIYDKVKQFKDITDVLPEFIQSLVNNENLAFVSVEGTGDHQVGNPKPSSPSATIIRKNSKEFKVLNYNVNKIEIRTNFDTTKFLVYNDSFYARFKAFVNGKETQILKSNVAFKGLWIPAGENTVIFQYGSRWQGIKNHFYLLLHIFVLLLLLRAWTRRNSEKEKSFL